MKVTDALSRYTAESGADQAGHARRYFEWLAVEGGQADADAVFSRYLRHLEQEGRKPGTVDLARRSIRSAFRYFRDELRVNIRVPKAKNWAFNPESSQRVSLSADLIHAMVDLARTGQCTQRQCSVLGLSSVYGLRAIELAGIRNEDVDREGCRLFIRTAKGGHPRWCYLPSAIQPWLQDEWTPGPADTVEKVFNAIWAQVSEDAKPKGVGLHAIRRSLVRDLRGSGVSDPSIGRFMRWAHGGATGALKMVDWYAGANVQVGVGGQEVLRSDQEGTEAYDAETWAGHPYLPFWS